MKKLALKKLGLMSSLLLATVLTSCGSAEEAISPTTGTEISTGTESTALNYSSGITSTLLPEDYFSDRDYRSSLDSETPVTLTFSGSSITADGGGVEISGSIVTIVEEGTYILTGSLSEGSVVVNMADETHKAQLVLDNVTIENSTTAAIQVPVADKVFITTAEGSENHLNVTINNEDSVDAAIFARADLTLNGEGTLNIQVSNGDGVVGKDELTITSGTYNITGDGHGMDANDIIAIAQGNFNFNVEKDGFHCEHSEDTAKGNIYILAGNYTLNVGKDGFDAGGFLEINDGTFDIITNGGWASAPVKVAVENHGGMGGMTGMTGGGMRESMDDMDMEAMMAMREEMMAQMGEEAMSSGRNEGFEGEMTQESGQMQGQMGAMPEGQMDGQMGAMPEGQTGQMQGQTGQMQGQTGQMQGQTGQMQGQTGQMQGQTGQTAMTPDMGIPQGTTLPPNIQIPEGIVLPEGLDLNDLSTLTPEMMESLMAQMTPEIMAQMGTSSLEETFEEAEPTESTKGLKSVGELRIYGGIFKLDCYDDALHSDSRLEIHGGDFLIGTADDAVHANWETVITGGNIIVESCFEGIEGQRIEISGGNMDMLCGDDGINAATASMDPEDSTVSLTISGGTIIMDTNMEGDGLDSNGSILISGGSILVSSTADVRDTQLDSQHDSIITGGSFIATGSNSVNIQNFNDGSTQASILVTLPENISGQVTLTDSTGAVLVDFLPVKNFQSVTISVPELAVGSVYTLTAGDYTEEITLESLQYGTSGNMGGGGGRR